MTTPVITNPEQEVNELKTIIASALQQAKSLGASAAEVGVSAESGLSVTARLGQVETVVFNRDKNFGITVYKGKSKGSASTSDSSPAAIASAVKAACDIAQFTEADQYAGLADDADLAKNIINLDLYHPWALSPQAAIELAIDCESKARAYDKRITNSEGASVEAYQGRHAYGNTNGFLEGYSSTRHSISCMLVAGSGDGMVGDYWYTTARDTKDLESTEIVGKKAAERCIAHLNARRIATCKAPVLFAADIAGSLISTFNAAIRGSSLYRKASFLVDSIGKPIFPNFVRIYENPLLAKGLGSACYDSEGVATNSSDIVTEGILQRYLLSSYAARRLGLKTTGNAGGVHNLFITPGEKNFAALLKEMDRGLVITELMGQGINLVTGNYSRGASGFWVEQGEIKFPVHEITIAGNLRDMFAQIVAVGNDVDRRGNVITGSILIENMTIAGT